MTIIRYVISIINIWKKGIILNYKEHPAAGLFQYIFVWLLFSAGYSALKTCNFKWLHSVFNFIIFVDFVRNNIKLVYKSCRFLSIVRN